MTGVFIQSIFLELPPLVIKLIFLLFFYFILNYMLNRQSQAPLLILKKMVFFLIIRDIVYTILRIVLFLNEYKYNIMLFLAISDVVVISLWIMWVEQYTKKKPLKSIFIINCAVGLFILLLAIFSLFGLDFLGLQVKLIGHHIVRIVWFWILMNQIYLAIVLIGVSEYNTDEPAVILSSRRVLLLFTIFINIGIYLIFVEGYNSIKGILNTATNGDIFFIIPIGSQMGNLISYFFVNVFLIPLSYLPYTIVLSNYAGMLDDKVKDSLLFVQNDLDSLFEFIQVLSTAMATKLSSDEILKHLIASTVKSSNADAGAILMVDDFEDIIKVKAVSGFFPPLYQVPNVVKSKIGTLEAYFQSTPIKIGETVLGEAVRDGEPIFIRNTHNDGRMKANTHNDTLFVSSVIIMPLIISKRVLGALAVIKRDQGKLFSDNDYAHLKTIAQYASLIIDFLLTYMEVLEKKEMEREIGIAAEIQQKFLPKKFPRLNNVVLDGYTIPAKGVSGDYYDIIQLKDDKVALVICDVAGKGYAAGLVMVMIRSILHLIASSDREVATILTWVNRGISGHVDIDHYATMSILFFDQSSNELTYANAAHHPLLIYRKKTRIMENIDTEGLPIGIEKAAKYGQKRTVLNSGDVIVLYTDGIIEAMNNKGEQYTIERFTELIASNADLSPKEIIASIKTDISAFVGNAKQHDDQTLLLMKVN